MKTQSMRITVLTLAIALSGCASTGNPRDPLEGFNRAVFTFNDKLDQVALKPAATLYEKVLPEFAQAAVGNFFGNISDVWTMANSFMQGKVHQGLDGFMRIAVNTTFGLGGVIDMSSYAGLTKHNEDFGQTLGYWGVGSGPFVMLPLFGPSTIRDAAGLPVDFAGNLWSYVTPVSTRNIGAGVRVVDERAALLDASGLLEDAALDRYQFVRDAWMQRRQSQVLDGESSPPAAGDNDAIEQSPAGPAPVVPAAPAQGK